MFGSFLTLILPLALGVQEKDVTAKATELIRALGSDSIVVRSDAYLKLKTLGKDALPALREAAKASENEVALAVRRAIQAIEIQADLTPRLIRVLPHIDDKLARGVPEAWTDVFLEIRRNWWKKGYYRELTRRDVDALVARAIASAPPDKRAIVASYAGQWRLESAFKALIPLLGDRESAGSSVAAIYLGQLNVSSYLPEIRTRLQKLKPGDRVDQLKILGQGGSRHFIPDLVKLLEVDDWAIRKRALEALAPLKPREAIPWIRKCLKDDSGYVRMVAVDALYRMGDVASIPALAKTIEPGRGDPSRVMDALLGMNSEEGERIVVEFLSSPVPEIRQAACNHLGSRKKKSALKAIQDRLGDPILKVRQAAAEALGVLGERSALPALRKLCRDPERLVRLSAGNAVLKLDRKEGIRAFIDFLDDSDAELRLDAMARLGTLGEAKAIPAILRRLQKKEPEDQRICIEALWDLKAKECVPEIRKFLDAADPHLRLTAAGAVWELDQDTDALGNVIRSLTGNDPKISIPAYAVALTLDQEKILPHAASLLESPSTELVVYALALLGSQDVRGAVAKILPLLDDKREKVRMRAVMTLGKLRAKAALPYLEAIVRDPSRIFRRRRIAAEAISDIKGKDAVPMLLELLEDPMPSLRGLALDRLEHFSPRDSVPAVTFCLEDPDAGIRREAASWLARQGSTRGVELLLEEVQDLRVLNALRAPETWRTLSAKKLDGSREGPAGEILEWIASKAGFEVEIHDTPSVGGHPWSRVPRYMPAVPKGQSALEALRWITHDDYTVIFEPDRIRVVPRGVAKDFWTSWWRTREGDRK